MSESNSEVEAKLLSDKPLSKAEKDAFGSHKKIAKSIKKLINKDENGEKTVALKGRFGSGKSTILSILSDNLKELSNAELFQFNVWTHEGDPIRRSFLERLIEFLIKVDFLPEKHVDSDGNEREWGDIKDEIGKRVQNKTVYRNPKITNLGKFLILSVLVLLPVGLAFITNAVTLPQWVVVVGALLVISPLLGWGFRDKLGGGKSSSDVSALVSQLNTHIDSKTSESPEPTAVEFKKYFTDILNDSLEKESERKLVIAIDNLDRVAPEEALKVWSLMRALFDFDNQPWLDRLWVIVAYDEKALNRLWESETYSSSSGLTKEFEKKSFQLSFDVPLPVLTDWKEYFIESFQEAFQNIEVKDGQIDTVYLLFKRWIKNKTSRNEPTPREVKRFINNVVGIYLQWKKQIPITIQALYVLCSENINKPEQDITIQNLDYRYIRLIEGEDWKKYLATIHYNTDPDKAKQILLKDQIEQFLLDADGENLKEYQQEHGFEEACKDLVEEKHDDEWKTENPFSIPRVSKALYEIEFDVPKIWGWLAASAKSITTWQRTGRDNNEYFSEIEGEGIALLIEKYNETMGFSDFSLVGSILEALASTRPVINNDDQQEKIIHEWLTGITLLLEKLEDLEFNELIEQKFRVEAEPKYYLEILKHVPTDRGEIHKYFLPKTAANEVTSVLNEEINSNNYSSETNNAVKVMLETKEEWSWQEISDSCFRHLNDEQNTEAADASILLKIIITLALQRNGNDQAIKHLNDLSNSGHLFHYLHEFVSHKDREAVGFCLLAILDVDPLANTNNNAVNTNSGKNTYQNNILSNPEEFDSISEISGVIIDQLIRFGKVDQLIEKAETNDELSNFVGYLLRKILKTKSAFEIDADLLHDHFPFLYRVISQDSLTTVVSKLLDSDELIQKLTELDIEDNIDLIPLYRICLEVCSLEDIPEVVGQIKNYLQSIDSSQWETILNNYDERAYLLGSIAFQDDEFNLGIDFCDALKNNFEKIIDGDLPVPEANSDRWFRLFHALGESERDEFLDVLQDSLLDKNQSLAKIVASYGKVVFENNLLINNSDRLFRDTFSGILQNEAEEEIYCIDDILDTKPSIKDETKTSLIKNFEKRIKNKFDESSNSNLQNALNQLADNFDLTLRSKEDETD